MKCNSTRVLNIRIGGHCQTERDAMHQTIDHILTRTAALGPVFAERASWHDETGEFPYRNFDDLHAAGTLALTQSAALGGAGGGLAAGFSAVNLVAKGDPSTALVLAMHLSQTHALSHRGEWPAHLVKRVAAANLDGVALLNSAQVEPNIGSPSHGSLPETVARRDGDHWRITGHKIYATGIPMMRWMQVLAVTDEAHPRLGSFLVPIAAEGVEIRESWNATGMRATRSDDLILTDVRVPFADTIGLAPAAEGLKRDARESAWYFALIAAVYDGVAQAARDWLVEFTTSRAPASLGAPLSTLPRVQDAIGKIEVLLGTNRRLLRGLVQDYDAGVDFGGDAALVKHVAIDNAQAVVLEALELGGNPGFSRDNPLERHLRNVLGGKVHAPQNNMIRAGLGRSAVTPRPTAPKAAAETGALLQRAAG